MKVLIDGVEYVQRDEDTKAAYELLRFVYRALRTEANYDLVNDTTRAFALPLAEKMRQANKVLRFSE